MIVKRCTNVSEYTHTHTQMKLAGFSKKKTKYALHTFLNLTLPYSGKRLNNTIIKDNRGKKQKTEHNLHS